MTQLRPPGVHESRGEQRFTPLRLAASGIPAFIGLTERGPTNAPVKVRSIAAFHEVFGRLSGGYLADSVRGFFDNGGVECHVLRVAHLGAGRGEVARCASARLNDAAGEPTLLIEAVDEGAWGNDLRVSARPSPPRVRSFVTVDLQEGDTEAVLRSTHGFEVGTVVRIHDGDNETYRTVVERTGKVLRWAAGEPLERAFSSGGPTYVEPLEFEIVVRHRHAEERFVELSMAPGSPRYVSRVIARASRLVRARDLESATPYPGRQPLSAGEVVLGGGTDGLGDVGPGDFIGADLGPGRRFGLAALEELREIDLVLAPDLSWCAEHSAGFHGLKDFEVVQRAIIEHCEAARTRFAILDFPRGLALTGAQEWRLLFDSPYAAFYFPWLVVRDADGSRRSLPPSGHVAGVFARSDGMHGVYRAPANEEIEGVVDLELVLHEEDVGALNHRGINCLRSFPARGIRVWGARTASSDRSQRHVNVRRNLSAIIRSLDEDLQWVVFEPNAPTLWKTVARNVSYFLLRLWEAGYFSGRSPEDAFFVKCDEETNPPELRDAGELVVEVGVAPVRPAEFIVFRVSQSAVEPEASPGVSA